MRQTALLLAVVVVVHLTSDASPSLAGQGLPAKESPFVGSWTANYSKSKLHPSYQFRSTTLQISIAGDTVTLASVLVTASGEERRAAETFRTDGTETPGTLSPGVLLVARWVGPSVLATVASKGGQVIALVTYELSADRTTLTARTSGMLEQVVVFDRKS